MPYSRPTLSTLQTQVAQDIAAGLPGSDPLLRFSNLAITGKAQANLANLQYGYLDWISLQAIPFTSEGEFLEAWAALKNVYREPATSAAGVVTFTAPTAGVVVPAGTPLTRSDGTEMTTSASATSSGGVVLVAATVNADPTGLTGAFGNAAVGTLVTLGTAIEGIQSNGSVTTAFIDGADLETDASLLSHMLEAYQNPPQGGAQNDYVGWALDVNGITRAWVNPNGFGAGTVVVYIMLDESEAAYNGFPQGTGGVATDEPRAAAATGDQLTVANYIFGPNRQPVTALVYVEAPTASPQNFTISGLAGASGTILSAVEAAIAGAFVQFGAPVVNNSGVVSGGTVYLEDINEAIQAVANVPPFVITSPTANITTAIGYLPTLGTVTPT